MKIKPIEPETDVIAMIHRMGGATQGHLTPPHMKPKTNTLTPKAMNEEQNVPANEFIQPIIFYRNSFTGGDGWTYYAMRVTIAAHCPTCGQRRGPLVGGRVIEDGESSFVNNWDNPCGHQDSYKDAYLEYTALKREGVLADNGLPVAGTVLEDGHKLHPNAVK